MSRASFFSNYLALGAAKAERCAAYRALVTEILSDDDIEAIRGHVQRQRAWIRSLS
jgi:hypothetical protein